MRSGGQVYPAQSRAAEGRVLPPSKGFLDCRGCFFAFKPGCGPKNVLRAPVITPRGSDSRHPRGRAQAASWQHAPKQGWEVALRLHSCSDLPPCPILSRPLGLQAAISTPGSSLLPHPLSVASLYAGGRWAALSSESQCSAVSSRCLQAAHSDIPTSTSISSEGWVVVITARVPPSSVTRVFQAPPRCKCYVGPCSTGNRSEHVKEAKPCLLLLCYEQSLYRAFEGVCCAVLPSNSSSSAHMWNIKSDCVLIGPWLLLERLKIDLSLRSRDQTYLSQCLTYAKTGPLWLFLRSSPGVRCGAWIDVRGCVTQHHSWGWWCKRECDNIVSEGSLGASTWLSAQIKSPHVPCHNQESHYLIFPVCIDEMLCTCHVGGKKKKPFV